MNNRYEYLSGDTFDDAFSRANTLCSSKNTDGRYVYKLIQVLWEESAGYYIAILERING